MRRKFFATAAAASVAAAIAAPEWALAQKQGGVLREYIIDRPASMSIHEESTVVAERPMMAVFNNLVLFDQHLAQNSLSDIVPELATDWAWTRMAQSWSSI
jgi:peptide/nickel transport system substrate-binding protein